MKGSKNVRLIIPFKKFGMVRVKVLFPHYFRQCFLGKGLNMYIVILYTQGFFGKGLMSRGAPSVYKNLPYVHIPSTKDSEPDVVHVMRKRM